MAILLLTSALCSLALGLGYFLLGVMGITGVGLAWLVSQSLVAIVVLLTGLRPILLAQMPLNRMLHLFERPRRLWWHWLSQRHIKQNQALIQHSRQALPSQSEWDTPGSWLVQRAVHTGSDRMVLALGPQDKTLVALSKSRSTQANLSLQKQALVLAELLARSAPGRVALALA